MDCILLNLVINSHRIFKDYTNRHMGDALKQLMIRLQMEDKLKALFLENEDKDELTDLFCNTHVCI